MEVPARASNTLLFGVTVFAHPAFSYNQQTVMRTQNEQPTPSQLEDAIYREAVAILTELDKDLPQTKLKDLLVDVLLNHVNNERNSIMGEDSMYAIYCLHRASMRVEKWLAMQPKMVS